MFLNVRFFEHFQGVNNDLDIGGEFADFAFFAAEGKELKEARVDSAFEFRFGPVLIGGFNFVEAAFVRVLDAHEQNVMGPTQPKKAARCNRQCLTNSAPIS